MHARYARNTLVIDMLITFSIFAPLKDGTVKAGTRKAGTVKAGTIKDGTVKVMRYEAIFEVQSWTQSRKLRRWDVLGNNRGRGLLILVRHPPNRYNLGVQTSVTLVANCHFTITHHMRRLNNIFHLSTDCGAQRTLAAFLLVLILL